LARILRCPELQHRKFEVDNRGGAAACQRPEVEPAPTYSWAVRDVAVGFVVTNEAR
jgi:hypothetical protein